MAYNNPFRRSVTRTAPILPVSQPRANEFKESRPDSDSNRESSHENLGLEIIYDPCKNGYPGEPDFDIVVVHGLLESPEHTWTWPSQVSGGAPDNYSSHRQQGLSSFVQDVLSPLSNTAKRPGLRHQTSQNEERQEQDFYTRKYKKARRKKRSRVNWLKDSDMLPNSFPHARVMSFNYDWGKRSTTFQIRNKAAYRLLKALAEDREDTLRFPPRPIVFIGHSFGGVVIQTTLVLAEQEKFVPGLQRNNDPMWQYRKETLSEILKATVGVIFLATPFKITKSIQERWAKVGVDLAPSSSKTSEPQTIMQAQISKGSASNLKASKITDQFNLDFLETTRAEHFRLACFYEKHPKSLKESSFLDMESSTLPGYPKIPLMTNHTGMSKFPSENDRSYRVVVDVIKGFLEFAPTRQLWKAISIGGVRSVQMMLDLGADPNLQDVQGESSLHKAVRCEENPERVLKILLSRGADINLKDVGQKTALSIAESESKDAIARFLRRNGATREFWDMKRIADEHPLDKIYMDGPSHSSNIETRWDLEVLDSNCEDACHRSTLSITHFNQCSNSTLDRYRSKTSIFDALYDKYSSKEIIWNALTKYQEANGMETKPASFTWYHLPANNMAWVEKLFTILFKDWVEKDATETLRVLRSLSGEQHRLNSSNFLYMRPDCKIVDLRFEVEQKVGLKLFMPYLHYEKSSTQAEMRKWMDQSTKSYDRREIFKRKPSETTLAITIERSNTGITESTTSSSNLQESEQEDESKPAPQVVPEAKGIFGEFISKYMDDPPELYLISGYLNKEPPLHIRRSLDQFYSISKQDDMIDCLDMDQVVYKHFDKKMPKRKTARPSASRTGSWETETTMSDSHENVYPQAKHGDAFQELLHKWEKESKSTEDHPIVIVDQLWLWIIDGGKLSSFPQPSEASPNGILERIEEKLKVSDVNNIGDLASLIIDECAGFLDRCRAPENIAILDIYDETISDAMKQQVEFFDRFTKTVLISAVREEYHKQRKLGNHLAMEQELCAKYKEKASSILSADFDQSPLSIIQEAELLREIRDAKEELNIIKRILEQQDRVIEKGFKPVATRAKDNEAVKKFNGGSMSPGPALVECRHNHERNAETILSTIQNSLRSVKAMLERGDEVCDGLKTLLDLKQKEINVQEARATRQIAQGNEKQSKIILIFTIVTIIFMPLSFLASFFALNIDGFPRGVDGGVEFGLSWVSGLIFGVTTAFVVPFVIGAFFFVAPSGRVQTRNLLRRFFEPFTPPILWLTARFRERRVTKDSRRRRSTSSEATGWDPVTYEMPSFD